MKKLKWAISTALCLCLLAGAIYAQADTGNQTSDSKSETTSLDKILAPTNKQYNPNELYVRMITATILVVVMGAIAIFLSKKVLPKITAPQGRQIRLIETIHLGSRKSLHLIQVADQKILVGSSSEHITKIADINSPTFEQTFQDAAKG